MSIPKQRLCPVAIVAAALFRQVAVAEISCPEIFTDHMVLQRDQPVTLWGTADPGESVTATFADQSTTATANQSGDWSLKLAPMKASFEPRALVLSGENELRFQDVLVGEVWLCSGQSNMEKPLGEQKGQLPTTGYPAVLEQADIPPLRLFTMPRSGKIKNPDTQKRWLPCSPESVESTRFSAAGFYFGKKLVEELDVPIGLIHASYGGSMIEAWMPETAFASEELAPLLDQPYFAWVDGVQATELYGSMIAPLAPYTLRGFLWYQGEANLLNGDGQIYTQKMRALISAWRSVWSAPDAPFYFAQIAPFTYSEHAGPKALSPDALPLFWEAQMQAARAIPNVGIIPTLDLVEDVRDIHPTNKKDIGERFARVALTRTYGRKLGPTTPPLFQSLTQQNAGVLRLELQTAPKNAIHRGLVDPSLFEIAGDDLRYQPATVAEEDGAILLSNQRLASPLHARYAWSETATPEKPVDPRDLPLYPFRTDTAPLETLRQPTLHARLSSATARPRNACTYLETHLKSLLHAVAN